MNLCMKLLLPIKTEPTGAAKPLLKQIVILSISLAILLGCIFDAIAAFIKRAPSM